MSLPLRREPPHGDASFAVPAALVVDPDPVMRQFLRRLLERHGLDVMLASSAEQALLVLAHDGGALRVVVHAATLGHGDVMQMADRLRGIAPHVPVVTYGDAGSGSVRAEEGRRAAQPVAARAKRGARGPGPFDAEVLARAVLRAMDSSRNGSDDGPD